MKLTSPKVLLLLAIGVFCALELHHVLVLGKTADGVEYAAVARNLAEGLGTFWRPYLSDCQFPLHYEQPPLFYGIQALFFLVLGDCDYVEGIYGVLVGALILLVVAMIWRRVRRDQGRPEVGPWWPILLLLAVSHFFYIVQANRLIPTFMVFALLSVYFSYRSVSGRAPVVLHAALAGLAVYLAFMTKGPFALFALAVPPAAWIAFRVPPKRALAALAVCAATFAALFGLTLALFPAARTLWSDLLLEQVLATVTGAREARSSMFLNVKDFFLQMAGPVGLTVVVLLLGRTRPRELRLTRTGVFFLLVALAGSLPLFLVPRQKIRYMLHSFPLYLMALATATEMAAARIEAFVAERRRARVGVAAAAGLLILGSIVAMFAREGEVTKAWAFYEDIYLQDLGIPERSTVTVVPGQAIWNDKLFEYAPRHLKISLTRPTMREYLILDTFEKGAAPPPGYRRINHDPVIRYEVYRRE